MEKSGSSGKKLIEMKLGEKKKKKSTRKQTFQTPQKELSLRI